MRDSPLLWQWAGVRNVLSETQRILDIAFELLGFAMSIFT